MPIELFDSTSFVVASEDAAKDLAQYCIAESQWFQVDPLPDSQWKFTVRSEFADLAFDRVTVDRG